MSDTNEQLLAALRDNKLSVTRPRRAVFASFQQQEPLTMSELVRRCPSIDRASIYRTVALFEKLGIVQRLQIGWKYKLELSNSFQSHHHHLTCIRCGSIFPLPEDQALEKRLLAIATNSSFLAIDHQIEIRGTCQHCLHN